MPSQCQSKDDLRRTAAILNNWMPSTVNPRNILTQGQVFWYRLHPETVSCPEEGA